MNYEKKNSLESDLEELAKKDSDMSWFMRMALMYRSEKKKIIRN